MPTRLALTLSLLWLATPLGRSNAAESPAALTPAEVADGWLMLFDGETTFGWPAGASVEKSRLVLAAPDDKPLRVPLSVPHQGELVIRYSFRPAPNKPEIATFAVFSAQDNKSGRVALALSPTAGDAPTEVRWPYTVTTGGDVSAECNVPPGSRLTVESLRLKPAGTAPLLNGKDLDGWRAFAGDPKKAVSKFEVTPKGELHVTNGPGDLQTVKSYADFCLQFDCKTRGKALNSGIFFRCLPEQYQNGYEAQIHNGFKDGDRAKPSDFGTGAIYRRVPARKVVSDDGEWFTMTVLAVGPRLRTWVNGYPTVDWTDDRPKDDNPRKGLRTAAGHLSIQGHDPTTDILFRNLRISAIR